MEKQSGRALRAGLALLALLCASAAFGQMYEPDDEEAVPPAPIPRAHMHPHPMYDPRDEPPMEPDPDRFPRRGARMMPGDEVDRLPLPPPPPPPMERSGPRPMPIDPDFDRLPPRERNSARLMTPGPIAEAPRARPRAIVPPPAPKESQLRNERAARTLANIADNKGKSSAKPVAAVRNENPPARVAAPPPPPRQAAAAQNPASTPAPVPVQMTRAPETLIKPRSDLDNVSGFVNKGEGKFNLEK